MNVKRITTISLTATIYAVLTLLLPFFSYREIQLRFSEIMTLLAFINPVFAPGIVLGCFLANIASPYGIIDMIVGTTASTLAMFMVVRSKNLFIASLWPTFFCFLIGFAIIFGSGIPFTWYTLFTISISVMIGEFVVVTAIGYPLFKYLMKNEGLMKILKSK